MNDPHINYSSDWQTPPEWEAWITATLGTWWDPCPSGWDGSEDTDGLSIAWARNAVYCNPPGSNSNTSVKAWWRKAIRERPQRIIWCFFNCEHTRHVDPSPWELQGVMVIPRSRIAFLRDGKPQKSPRNWAWLWSSVSVAAPPVSSFLVPTGVHAKPLGFGERR